MKKQIKISQYHNDFTQRIDFPITGGDLNAYEIVWELPQAISDAQLVIQAKRADDTVITDSNSVNGSTAKITLKNNIYSIPGLLTIRVQIVCDSEVLTQCQLICDVLEAYEGEDIAEDDRTPALTSLIAQASEAAAKANAAAKRVPSTQELENLQESLSNKVDKIDGKGLSANDFTNALKARVEKSVTYKGSLANKEALPTSAAVGDMYIVGGSNVTAVYDTSTIEENSMYNPAIYGFSSLANLMTESENEQYEQAPSTGGGVDMCDVKVYDTSWNYITTVSDTNYADGPALWGMWESVPEGLSQNTTYYVTRADNQTPLATTPTHVMEKTDPCIAVYDGSAWQMSPIAKDGKGLSANDFTNDLKTKLDGLKNYDTEISALDTKINNISALPKVAWNNIDSCKTAGTYLVTGRKDYDTTPVEGGSYAEYSGGYPILIVSDYTYYYEGAYSESGYRQVLYDANGKAVWRIDYTGMSSWTEWSDCIDAPTIIHQSQIQSVSSTVTTYTFSPKSYLSPSAAFSINHTGTNTVTFNFGSVTNSAYTNEILIYFKTELDNAVVWGSNVKFTDDEVPTIEAGVYYRIVGEYNPLMGKWVVGVINDGEGAA